MNWARQTGIGDAQNASLTVPCAIGQRNVAIVDARSISERTMPLTSAAQSAAGARLPETSPSTPTFNLDFE
jgi:hypothetical protein